MVIFSSQRKSRNLALSLLALALVFTPWSQKTFAETNWSAIQTAMMAHGEVLPGDVLRFELARLDLPVRVNGISLPVPTIAAVANGFVAFKEEKNGQFYVDGSLPAQESEVGALEDALLANSRIHITAVGGRFLNVSPNIISVHFEAMGSGAALAQSIATALATIHDPQLGVTVIPGLNSVIDPATILPPKFLKLFDEGYVEQFDLTFAFYLPRPDEKYIDLAPGVPAETGLGVGQSFNIQFSFTGGTNVTLDIDFALRANELPAVQSILRKGGFSLSSLSNNHIKGEPTLYYLHATGSGDGFALGNTLYDAIQAIKSGPRSDDDR
jgi:hypothetical protein